MAERLLRTWVAELIATPGLTAMTDPAAAWARHVEEALALVPLLAGAPAGPIVDVGAGGGSVGIPVAVSLPARGAVPIEAAGRPIEAAEHLIEAVETTVERPSKQSLRARRPLRSSPARRSGWRWGARCCAAEIGHTRRHPRRRWAEERQCPPLPPLVPHLPPLLAQTAMRADTPKTPCFTAWCARTGLRSSSAQRRRAACRSS